MFSRPALRWILIPLYLVGLWPLIQMVTLDAATLRQVAPVAIFLMGGSCLTAIALTLGFLELVGHRVRPVWLGIVGIGGIFLAAFTIAEFFGVIWLLPMFLIGWGLTHWLLELRELIHGPLVGMLFILSRIVGMFFGAMGISLSPPM